VFPVRYELNSYIYTAFCPQNVSVCSVWFSQLTAIVSLNSINRLGVVAGTLCVSCEVRTEFLYRSLPTECICVFCMVLTINSDCFPKQH
jgi:hypothetical protein